MLSRVTLCHKFPGSFLSNTCKYLRNVDTRMGEASVPKTFGRPEKLMGMNYDQQEVII